MDDAVTPILPPTRDRDAEARERLAAWIRARFPAGADTIVAALGLDATSDQAAPADARYLDGTRRRAYRVAAERPGYRKEQPA